MNPEHKSLLAVAIAILIFTAFVFFFAGRLTQAVEDNQRICEISGVSDRIYKELRCNEL